MKYHFTGKKGESWNIKAVGYRMWFGQINPTGFRFLKYDLKEQHVNKPRSSKK